MVSDGYWRYGNVAGVQGCYDGFRIGPYDEDDGVLLFERDTLPKSTHLGDEIKKRCKFPGPPRLNVMIHGFEHFITGQEGRQFNVDKTVSIDQLGSGFDCLRDEINAGFEFSPVQCNYGYDKAIIFLDCIVIL